VREHERYELVVALLVRGAEDASASRLPGVRVHPLTSGELDGGLTGFVDADDESGDGEHERLVRVHPRDVGDREVDVGVAQKDGSLGVHLDGTPSLAGLD